jgi:tetratricopeptide (TPR) repeat protein
LKPTAAGLSNLGTLYFRLRRDAEAAATLERALRIEGNNYRVWANLGAIYNTIPGAGDRANAAFAKAIELGERERATNPRRPPLLADLASFYADIGQAAQSRRLAESALAGAPEDPTILYKIALAEDQLGDRARAIALLSDALRHGYPRQSLDEDRAFAHLKSDPKVVDLLATQGDVRR